MIYLAVTPSNFKLHVLYLLVKLSAKFILLIYDFNFISKKEIVVLFMNRRKR